MTTKTTNDPVREVLRELSQSASPGERFITSPAWQSYDALQGGPPASTKPVTVRSAEELATRGVTYGDEEHEYVPSDPLLKARPARLVDALTIIPIEELAGVTERREDSSTGGADTHTLSSAPGTTSSYTEFSATFTRSAGIAWTRLVLYAAMDESSGIDDATVRNIVDTLAADEVTLKLEDVLLNASTAGGDNFDGLVAAAATTVARDTVNGETRHDAIRRAATTVGTLPGRALVLSPSDAEALSLEKDANGNYLAGAGILTDAIDRRVQSEAVAAGTAIVTSLPRQRLYVKQPGVAVGLSPAHDDWFTKGWIALRAVMKMHAMLDAAAIVKVTL